MTHLRLSAAERRTLFTFGVVPGGEVVVTVVDGEPVHYSHVTSGPFPDEPDGVIKVGASHTFTEAAMLSGVGETEVDIEPSQSAPPVNSDPTPPGGHEADAVEGDK